MIQALRGVEWKVFGWLLAAGLLGVVAILPLAFDLFAGTAVDSASNPDLPLPVVVALALIQNAVLLAVCILIGMILSERIGLKMPIIRAWNTGAEPPDLRRVVLRGALVGGTVGAILIGIEALFFLPRLPDAMRSLFEIPLWKRLLAGVVYGGITEELFMRLFLMSLVAWLLGRKWQTPEGIPTGGAFRVAILVVAILFGLGHLPATAVISPLTPLLVVRALILNGIAGAAFGFLYWRSNLETAMLGHMSAHLVMQIPGFMLLRALT